MALLKYLKKKESPLPNSEGPLAQRMPSVAIASANKEVQPLEQEQVYESRTSLSLIAYRSS